MAGHGHDGVGPGTNMGIGKDQVLELLFVGDLHFCDSNPPSRKDSYATAILDKLNEIRDITEDYDVDAIFFSGDFFHKKRPTFHEANTLVKELLKFRCDVYGIFGNHDIFNLSSIEKRAAGFMITSRAIKILDDNSYKDKFHKVIVTGRSFHPSKKILPHKKMKDAIRIHVSHLDLYLSPPNAHVPNIPVKELSNLGCDILFNGHIHNDPGGPMKRIGRTNIYNLGSIGRPKIDETHQPGILLVSVSRGEILEERIIKLSVAKKSQDIFINTKQKLRHKIVDKLHEFAKELAQNRETRDRADQDLHSLLKKLAGRFGGKAVLQEALSLLDRAR